MHELRKDKQIQCLKIHSKPRPLYVFIHYFSALYAPVSPCHCCHDLGSTPIPPPVEWWDLPGLLWGLISAPATAAWTRSKVDCIGLGYHSAMEKWHWRARCWTTPRPTSGNTWYHCTVDPSLVKGSHVAMRVIANPNGSFRPEWYCTLHCDGFIRKFQIFKLLKIECL